MSKEIPSVLILKAITPSGESVRGETFTYNNLEAAVEKHVFYFKESLILRIKPTRHTYLSWKTHSIIGSNDET